MRHEPWRTSGFDDDAIHMRNEQEHPPVTAIRSLSLWPSLRATATVAEPSGAYSSGKGLMQLLVAT